MAHLRSHVVAAASRPLPLGLAFPDFLAPTLIWSGARLFSASSVTLYPRNGNPRRGESPLRRTGLNRPTMVSNEPLPKPVLDPAKRTQIKTDDDHPLWAFFPEDKLPFGKPHEELAHGRAWTSEELRRKSWEDLHSLWWICAKEINRLKTSYKELRRIDKAYGFHEMDGRLDTVKDTQKAIRHVLLERWYAWEDARRYAMGDPTVNLSGDGPAYEPSRADVPEEYLEEDYEERLPQKASGS